MEQRDTDRRTFTPEEVSEIIETATRLQQLADQRSDVSELTLDQLSEIAAELGISRSALAEAISAGDRTVRRERTNAAKRSQWFQHLGTYLIVISGLAALDWFSGGGFEFFFYPATAWGIGLALHALSAFKRF